MDLRTLRQGMTVPCDDAAFHKGPPTWLDKASFKRGQEFFLRHIAVCFLAMHFSLVFGFCLFQLLEALVFTEQSNTPIKSLKRYLQTAMHIYLWHAGDVWDDEDHPGYKSVRAVARMHAHVAADMKKKRADDDDDDGSSDDRVYLSQYDMGLVQTGFMGVIIMCPKGFGISPSTTELEDYIHFWRGIGYLLGIQDKYNICNGTYEETRSICLEIEDYLVVHELNKCSQKCTLITDAYIKGMNAFVGMPVYSRKAIVNFVLHRTGRPVLFRLSVADRLRFWIYQLHVWVYYYIPSFERYISKWVVRILKRLNEASFVERKNKERIFFSRMEKKLGNE